jgi:cation-dependent mannose-6-phosphate receptor
MRLLPCSRSICRQQNSELVFRGRKLVLNYTGGSPCDDEGKKRSLLSHEAEDIKVSELIDDDDEDRNPESKQPLKSTIRRKSTIISLLCEKEPMAPKAPPAAVAFVGASEDECTYFFEVRSPAACAGAETDSSGGALGPGGVFGVM